MNFQKWEVLGNAGQCHCDRWVIKWKGKHTNEGLFYLWDVTNGSPRFRMLSKKGDTDNTQGPNCSHTVSGDWMVTTRFMVNFEGKN